MQTRVTAGVALSLAALVLAVAGTPAYAQRPERKPDNILVVHSGSPDSPTNVIVNRSFGDALTADTQYRIFDEYLEEYRLGVSEQKIADILRARYAGQKMSLLVGVTGPAVAFLLRYRDSLWPGTPIVFTHVDRRELPAKLPPDLTGVLVSFDFGKNLELALRMQPETKTVFYVGGVSPQDRALRAMAEEEFQPFTGRVGIDYLNGLSLSEIVSVLSKAHPRSIAFLSGMQIDVSGQSFITARISSALAFSASMPLYGVSETFIGRGVVAAHAVNIEAAARQAARLGLRILAGTPIAQLPVEQGPPSRTIADWRQAQRWDIDERLFPSDAVVMYRELTVWQKYRWQIATILLLCVVEGLLTATLLVQRKRKRQAELQLRESEQGLRESHDRIRELAGKLIYAQESERKLIARELHDDVNQRVAGLSIALTRLRDKSADPLRGEISRLQDKAERLADVIHDLSHGLHPAILEHAGLSEGLTTFCEEFAALHDMEIVLDVVQESRSIPDDVALCLFRVAQQSLVNIVTHAEARHARVSLTHSAGQLTLTVSDSGRGFNPGSTSGGLGIVSMSERLRILNGRFDVLSAPGEGTTIVASIPLDQTVSKRSAYV